MGVNSIKMTIELDGKDALKTIQALTNNLKKVGDTATKSTKKASLFGTILKANLVSIIAVNFGAVIRAQVGEAFDAFVDFETGLIATAKTANLTEKEVGELAVEIEKLAVVLPISTKELLSITNAAGQLGVKGVKNLAAFAEIIGKLGKVSNLAGGEAATVLTRILTVTGEGAEGLKLFADQIVSLGNNFAASESEIARMTNEIVRSTAQFGVSAGEAAALGATLRSFGVRAEEAGGVLTKSFIAINNAIQGGGEKLNKLSEIMGLTGDQVRKQFGENASKFFRDFVAGLATAGGGVKNISKNLEGLGIAGIRVSKVFAPLAANIGEYDRALGLVNAQILDGTALNEEFERSARTTAAATQLLSNAFEKAQRALGEKLAGAFKIVNPLLVDFLNSVGETGDETFIRTADNAEVLKKKLVELKDRLEKLNNTETPEILKESSAGVAREVADQIGMINKRLLEFDTSAAISQIKDLRLEVKNLSSVGTDSSPLLDSIYGTPKERAAKLTMLQAQLDGAVALRNLQSGQLLAIKLAEDAATIDAEKNKFDLLDELKIAREEFDAEKKELAADTKILDDELTIVKLQEILGKEEVLREISRIETLDNEAKQIVALAKLRKKARDKKEAQEKVARAAKIRFDRMADQSQINLAQDTANFINAISGKQSKVGLIIGKTAAVASVLVNDGIARAAATAAAAAAAPAAGPGAPALFALTLAQMQGVITASTALSLGTIAAQTIGAFAGGGTIPGTSQVNDRMLAEVNAGETILTKRQTNAIFSEINRGNVGGGSGGSITINNPVLMNQEGVDDLIDAINDAQEFRNKELRVG